MFWERFLFLCNLHNKKPNPVGKDIGLSSGVLTKWKQSSSLPSGEMLIKIADYFDCSIDFLVGRSEIINSHKNELKKKSLDYIQNFEMLSEDDSNEILMIINYKLEQQNKRNKQLSHSEDNPNNDTSGMLA